MRGQLRSKWFWTVSLAAGTAVVLLNHGDLLAAWEWSRGLPWQLLATYLLSILTVAYLGAADNRK